MSGHRIASRADIESLIGRDLGPSEWLLVTQEMVDAFGAVTGDTQWVHTDPIRAAAGPYGGTIAHGYLVFALGPRFMRQLLDMTPLRAAIHYGANKVRYPSPMPVGQRMRMRLRVKEVEPLPGAARATMEYRFEREGSDRPVCVAEVISQMVFDAAPDAAGTA